MSVGQVTKAKQELLDAGLIAVESKRGAHGDYHEIGIADIWARNAARYTQTEQAERSPHERMSSPHERKRSQGETKKNPLRKTSEEGDGDGFSLSQEQNALQARTERLAEKNRPTSLLQGSSSEQKKGNAMRNGSGVLLAERVAAELRKRGKEPNARRVDKAIQLWGERCDAAQSRGKNWSRTNIDGIIDVYDTLRNPGEPRRVVVDPANIYAKRERW